jgi:hypothetical protein
MPSNVTNYLGLTLMGVAISIVSAVMGFDEAAAQIPSPNGGTIILITDVVMFAISLGLIAAVAWGRQNWARWVQLVLYAIGLIFLAMLPLNPVAMAQLTSFKIGVIAITTVLQGVALFFIFTGNAKEWFVKKKPA